MSGRDYDDNDYNDDEDNYDDGYIDYHEAQRDYADLEREWKQDCEGWSNEDKIGHLEKMKFAKEQYVHSSDSVSKPAVVLATSSTFLDHTSEV